MILEPLPKFKVLKAPTVSLMLETMFLVARLDVAAVELRSVNN